MVVSAVWGWVATRLARHPLAVFLGLGLLALVPLLSRLTPFADLLASDGGRDPVLTLALGWSFLAALVGVLAAFQPLAQGRAFLRLLPPPTRWWGELGALAGVPLALQVPLLVGAWITPNPIGITGTGTEAPWGALLGLVVLDVHLAALALPLLRSPLPRGAQASAFLFVAWFVPALLAGAGGFLGGIARVLDASRHPETLRAFVLESGAAGETLWGLAPALAWLLIAWLLFTPLSGRLSRA